MGSKFDVRAELVAVLVRYGHSKALNGDLDVLLVEDLALVAERFAAEERATVKE